jgi:fibronectin-binding autotransporter adhesin
VSRFPQLKIDKRPVRTIAFCVAFLFASVAETVVAGNTATWNGNSGSSNNWNDTNNWVGGVQPQGGANNSIIHFAGTNRLSPNNDYGDDSQFQQILFDSGAGSFNLTGSRIKLFNNGGTAKIENSSSNSQQVSFSGALGFSLLLESSVEFDPTQGNLIINNNILGDSNTPTISVFGNNGHTLTINGVISQNSTTSFTLQDQGGSNNIVVFQGANTYTGDTQVNGGKLQFGLGGSASSSTIRLGNTSCSSTAEFDLIGGGGQSVGSTLVVRAGSSGTKTFGSSNTTGTVTWTGGVFLDDNLTVNEANSGGTLAFNNTTAFDVKNHVLTVTGSGNTAISGQLSSSLAGGGSLVKTGSGTLLLSNSTNNYTGTNSGTLNANGTQINAGTLAITSATALGLAPGGAYNNIQFTGSGTLQDNTSNITLGTTRNISIAGGATASFDSNGNSFELDGIINGSGGLTKVGLGTLTLGDGTTANANTYTGLTTVSAGTLLLNKLAGNNAIAGDANSATNDVTVSGGTLKWNQNEQVENTATITISSGTVDLNGHTETLGTLVNNGGTFTTNASGTGGHLIGTTASIQWNGGTDTITSGGIVEDGHITITGGTNTVQGGATEGLLHLLSGGAGLQMTGATLTLNSDAANPGRLELEGNVSTSASSTTSFIASGGSATNPGVIDLNGGTRTFTVAQGTVPSGGADLSISAKITNGSLIKAGTGMMTLTSANTYTGTTTINAGTLNTAAANALGGTSSITVNIGGTLLLSNSGTNDRINNSATMTLNGGTFNTAGLSEHGASNNTAGIGALTLSSTSTIDMGNIASIVAFANSAANAATWVGHTLNIYDWSGTPNTGGGTDQLYFGSDATGLTAAQLTDVQFFSGAGTGAYTAGAIILSDGEIVPVVVPEPSTWVGGALALLVIAYQFPVIRRRRLAQILLSATNKNCS